MTPEIDYNAAWDQWHDMIACSPAPFHRRRLIMKLIRRGQADSVLDVGCGNGLLLRQIKEEINPGRLTGIDVSDAVIARNRDAMPFGEFHVIDVASSFLSESFDLVTCSEVLEHVRDVDAALKHLRSMCSGRLILTVPVGRVFPIDGRMGHLRHFSRREMGLLLRKHGFTPEVMWRWGFPFHVIYKRLINTWPGPFMERFAGGRYSRSAKAVSSLLKWLFYANLLDFGVSHQLILCASVNKGG